MNTLYLKVEMFTSPLVSYLTEKCGNGTDRLKNQDGEINRNIMEEIERAWKAEVRRATVLKVWIWASSVHTLTMVLYTRPCKYPTIEPLNIVLTT